MLEAAHIRPVGLKGGHSLDNSVLLRSDLHNLFDLGLLCVGPDLKTILRAEVRDRHYRALTGRPVQLPRGVPRKSMVAAYSAHRAMHEV